MGFGCNAVGITGCRIIDSPRERLLALLTNSFVPCNGKFPSLIAIITVFFCSFTSGFMGSLEATLYLTLTVLLGVMLTFPVTALLSKTLLKGMPSSFILELPPYRKPQLGRVILQSLKDRALFVLGRAVISAAPAGLIIWLLSVITLNGLPLTSHITAILNPLGRLMGMDGIILTGFILGLPANETVLPLIAMLYTKAGNLSGVDGLTGIGELFRANGWTVSTAVCTIVFFLFHWPCATSLLTVKKETGSIKWTILSAIIPTLCGMVLCIIISTAAQIFGF